MSIPANIKQWVSKVRNEIYGKDVREAIASSVEATAEVAEWSRQVAQDIVDGKFDEGELATEIERKLNELETEYAPRLNSLDQQLAQNVQKLKNENANAEVPLSIPTYYANDNHTTHPSAKYFPDAKYGYYWVMAHTPYSEGRDRFENPSIGVSDDGYYWYVPDGLTNPLVDIPVPANTHYSDVELFDNGKELELWYRYTDKTITQSQIWRRKSTDCVNWSEPELVFDFGYDGENYFMSPTVIFDGVYNLWYRSQNGVIYYRQSTNLTTWTPVQACSFDFTGYGNHSVWHLEVRLYNGKYMAMVNAYQDGVYKLFYHTSPDGINFIEPKLLLEPTYSGWDNNMIYRASLVQYGGWYYVYYSAQSEDLSWYIGLSKGRSAYDLDELVGMKTADYNFVTEKSGVETTGRGALKQFNSGVASVQTQPTRTDTLSIYNESKTRKGFFEVAGIYLDTEDNETIYNKDKALYINPVSKALTYVADGAAQPHARIINFQIAANGGDGSLTMLNGNHFIESVASVSAGIQINFRSMPGNIPFVQVVNRTSTGLRTEDSKNISYIYISTRDKDRAVIGLKEDTTANHTPFNQVTSGTLDVCIVF